MRTTLFLFGFGSIAFWLTQVLGAPPLVASPNKGDYRIEPAFGPVELVAGRPGQVAFSIRGPGTEGAEIGPCSAPAGLEVSTATVFGGRAELRVSVLEPASGARSMDVCLFVAEATIRRTVPIQVLSERASGDRDPRFDVELPFPEVQKALSLSGGQLLLVGADESGSALARLMPSGQLDESFGEAGRVPLGEEEVVDVDVLPTGEGVVVRRSQTGDRLSRLSADGTLVDWPGRFSPQEPVTGIRVTRPVLLVATALGITGFRYDGRRDLSFGVGGEVSLFGPWNASPSGVFVRTRSSARSQVFRNRADGKLDRLLMGTGFRTLGLRPRARPVVDADGSFVVLGTVSSDACPPHALVRLDSAGRVDAAFGASGITGLRAKCPDRVLLSKLESGYAVSGQAQDGSFFVTVLDSAGKSQQGEGWDLPAEPIAVFSGDQGQTITLVFPDRVERRLI